MRSGRDVTGKGICEGQRALLWGFAVALFASFAAISWPAGNAAAATLDVGFNHACSMTSAGGLKCWGDNSYYGLGDGTVVSRESPVDVSGLGSTAIAVATGGFYSCALTTSGGVACWGYNGNLQVGNGSTEFMVDHPSAVVGLDTGVRAIATGERHACALTASGGVKCWGGNQSGGLGDGTNVDSATPVDVMGLGSGVVAIDVGDGYACAVTDVGGVKCWGRNEIGQLGDGTDVSHSVPVDVAGLTSGVSMISAGTGHTCAVLDSGGVKCWGANGAGALGDGSFDSSLVPVDSTSLQIGAIAVAAGSSFTCALTQAGGVQCWGYNARGQLGDGTAVGRPTAADVVGLQSGVTELAVAFWQACARLANSEIRCWGNGDAGQLGNGVPPNRAIATAVENLPGAAAAIAPGEHHACALTDGGAITCWGINYGGELGDGSMEYSTQPVPVVGMQSGVVSVATGSNHSCAITQGNGAYCWGSNFSGQVGDGTYANRPEPAAVWNMGANAAALALGSVHSCALTVDGGVKCWGGNFVGQLGNGTLDSRPLPVQVSGMESGIAAIDVGLSHSCALTNSGGVKCWGQNGRGELGDGTTVNRTTPTDVQGLEAGVTAIAAGGQGTCALMAAGAVKCWGNSRLVPEEVGGLAQPVTAISVGNGHACARTAPGGLQCWGLNVFGQLGDGSLLTTDTPVDVWGMDAGVSMLAAGDYYTCAITEAGAASCWGNNDSGQLGNGEAGYALTPQWVVGTPFGFLVFRNGFD